MTTPTPPSAPLTHKLILVALCGLLALQAVSLLRKPSRSNDPAVREFQLPTEIVSIPHDGDASGPKTPPAATRAPRPGAVDDREQPRTPDAVGAPSMGRLPTPQATPSNGAKTFVRVDHTLVSSQHTNELATAPKRVDRIEPNLRPGTGLSGRVIFQGTPPPAKTLPNDSQCRNQPFTGPLPKPFEVGAEGGLANALVSIFSGPTVDQKAFVIPSNAVPVEIENCLIFPYVFGARAGQVIRFHNRDPERHYIRMKWRSSGETVRINRPLLPDRELDVVLPEAAGHQPIQSDIKPWMFAYVSTFEHPWFAVTDTNGMYRLPPLEPGEHVICAQHRQRKLYEKVRVDETGTPQTLDFYFEETETSIRSSAKILSE